MRGKAFTPDEVNALIPALRRVLEEVRDRFDAARLHNEKLQVLDVLWGPKLLDRTNPDHAGYTQHRAAVESELDGIQALVAEEITARGIRFPPGGLEYGLLDFPTTIDGRWAYLCWQVDEPEVSAWHELDAGFAGRRLLTVELAARMGRREEAPRRAGDPADGSE